MKRSLYLPISAFVFPEVAGAEAVFPADCDVTGVFIGRSNYPTATTGTIPANPTANALILYSAPVTWAYREGPSMDYPLVIEIPETWVDKSSLTELKLASLPDGISAWAYSKTIFFGRDATMRYIFRTIREKRQRLDSLLSFTEIKDLEYIKAISSTFEEAGLPVVKIPDGLADDIRHAVSSLEIDPFRYKGDLFKETRCGACLGHVIASASRMKAKPISIEDVLKALPTGAPVAKAQELVGEITGKLKYLTQILSDSMGVECSALPISVSSTFKFKGRDCLQLWSCLDPRIRQCVDFIAGYPCNDWNWYGDEERFVFMRELWNQILQPALIESSPEHVDDLRAEIHLICRHFRNPNSVEFSFDAVRSPLLQAFCFALDCPRESEKMAQYLKHAQRPDYCLTVFGALRGFAYFSRTMFPGFHSHEPTDVPLAPQSPSKPIDKAPDMLSTAPAWASRLFNLLKGILAARKVTPKKSKALQESFCQAARECGSKDKLLATLSKKQGWGSRTAVYKELSQRMSNDSAQTGVDVKNLFVQGDFFPLQTTTGEKQSPSEPSRPLPVGMPSKLITDTNLAAAVVDYVRKSFSFSPEKQDSVKRDVEYLQKEYAPGGWYARSPEDNPSDNASTIRHLINLINKKTPLSDFQKKSLNEFLSERYT